MTAIREKLAWSLVAALGIAVVLQFAGVVSGGPLDPSDAPAPTMKTLADVPPSWHQSLSATGGCTSQRFTCVLGSTAVLDNETGLVWEKTPSAVNADWATGAFLCHGLAEGGRTGWRLPAIEQLMSLWDVSVVAAPRLPSGNPFSVAALSSDLYWSSTTLESDATKAYAVTFAGSPATTIQSKLKTENVNRLLWCVRGGDGVGAY